MPSPLRAPLAAVFFDLDGTLLDTAPDFATVVNLLLAEHARAPLPFEAVRAAVSHGSRALVTLAFGCGEEDPAFAPLRERLLVLYEQNLAVRTRPFPGMRALLAALAGHGIGWGVVTNKPAYLAEPLLARIAFEPPPAVLVCPDHVKRTKPDPEPLLLACERLGCSAAEAVYVGDHARDIESGRRAGMPTVAAAWGYLGPGETVGDWGADHAAGSVEALADLLLHRLPGSPRR